MTPSSPALTSSQPSERTQDTLTTDSQDPSPWFSPTHRLLFSLYNPAQRPGSRLTPFRTADAVRRGDRPALQARSRLMPFRQDHCPGSPLRSAWRPRPHITALRQDPVCTKPSLYLGLMSSLIPPPIAKHRKLLDKPMRSFSMGNTRYELFDMLVSYRNCWFSWYSMHICMGMVLLSLRLWKAIDDSGWVIHERFFLLVSTSCEHHWYTPIQPDGQCLVLFSCKYFPWYDQIFPKWLWTSDIIAVGLHWRSYIFLGAKQIAKHGSWNDSWLWHMT